MVLFNDLTKGLVSGGFLKTLPDQNVLVLQTPLVIEFSEKITKAILSHYDPDHEIGGVIMASPILQDGNRILSANKIVFLENLSPTPERQFYRPSIRNEIRKIWKDNSKKDGRVYIPLFFHSHPTIKLDAMNNINDLTSTLFPLKTSEADQKFSLDLQLSINGDKFLVPNALIVRSEITEQNTIVGFYGGGITPTDFSKYLIKLTGKTLEEILEGLRSWIEEDPNRIWIVLLLGGIVAIPIIFYPRQAIPIAIVLILILLGSQIIPIASQATNGLPNYFAIVKSEGTVIKIPRLQ